MLLESGSEARYPHPDMIQTNALTNPDNSGGPLVNLQVHDFGVSLMSYLALTANSWLANSLFIHTAENFLTGRRSELDQSIIHHHIHTL